MVVPVGNCQVLLSTERLKAVPGQFEIISRQLQVRPALLLMVMHEGRPASCPECGCDAYAVLSIGHCSDY